MDKYILDSNIIIQYRKEISKLKSDIDIIIPETVEDELSQGSRSYISELLDEKAYAHIQRAPPLYSENEKSEISFDVEGLSFTDIDIILIARHFHEKTQGIVTVFTLDNKIISVLSILGIKYSRVFPPIKDDVYIESRIDTDKRIKPKKKYETPPAIGVDNIAFTLSKIIPDFTNDTGMMVGIFGKWGRGKTYLFKRVLEKLQNNNQKDYIPVEFSAWKYQTTNSSWGYLYKSLYDEYLKDNIKKHRYSWGRLPIFKIFFLNIEKYGYIPILLLLLSIFLGVWFSFASKYDLAVMLQKTIGLILVVKVVLLYMRYKNSITTITQQYFKSSDTTNILGVQDKIQEEIKLLLRAWVKDGSDKKILLFIDDLDRCNLDQVVSTLDGLRLILDDAEISRKLIIIVAIDEKILKKSFFVKYKDFINESEAGLYREYLEKIFILGINLPPLDNIEKSEILSTFNAHYFDTLENKPVYSNQEKDLNYETKKVMGDSARENESTNEINKEISVTTINEFESSLLLKNIEEIEDITPRQIKIMIYKYILATQLFTSLTGNEINEETSKDILMIFNKNVKTNNKTINKIAEMLSVI